mmetsp:Transcript_17101/g.34041  ORF Transcript_17101/g.34041 Transcript_17101/m.34041 type:complete len:210 (-) Transcript_17101:211-840(-)
MALKGAGTSTSTDRTVSADRVHSGPSSRSSLSASPPSPSPSSQVSTASTEKSNRSFSRTLSIKLDSLLSTHLFDRITTRSRSVRTQASTTGRTSNHMNRMGGTASSKYPRVPRVSVELRGMGTSTYCSTGRAMYRLRHSPAARAPGGGRTGRADASETRTSALWTKPWPRPAVRTERTARAASQQRRTSIPWRQEKKDGIGRQAGGARR